MYTISGLGTRAIRAKRRNVLDTKNNSCRSAVVLQLSTVSSWFQARDAFTAAAVGQSRCNITHIWQLSSPSHALTTRYAVGRTASTHRAVVIVVELQLCTQHPRPVSRAICITILRPVSSKCNEQANNDDVRWLPPTKSGAVTPNVMRSLFTNTVVKCQTFPRSK